MDFHKLEIQFSTMSANINTIYIYILFYFILFFSVRPFAKRIVSNIS